MALTEDEQEELRDRVREIWTFVREVKQSLGDSGVSLEQAMRALGERRG